MKTQCARKKPQRRRNIRILSACWEDEMPTPRGKRVAARILHALNAGHTLTAADVAAMER